MASEREDAVPCWRLRGDLSGRFAPDVHLAIVRGGGKKDAVLGVGPGDAPDGTFMAGGLSVCVLAGQ